MDLPLHEGFGSSNRLCSESELGGLRDESELAAIVNTTGEEVTRSQPGRITDSSAESDSSAGEASENGAARGLVGESERPSSNVSIWDSSPSSTALSQAIKSAYSSCQTHNTQQGGSQPITRTTEA